MSGSGPSYEGSLELPFMGEKATLNGFNRDDRSLVFTASNSTYSLHFVGEVKGGMFEGSVQDGPTNVSGDRFRFAHLARIDFSKYTGGYDLGGGRVISISPIPEQDMGAIAASVVQYTDTGMGDGEHFSQFLQRGLFREALRPGFSRPRSTCRSPQIDRDRSRG